MLDLVVRNGRVLGRGVDVVADVGIAGERIVAVQPGLTGERVIDAAGSLVLPGAIDGHVHIRTDRTEWSYDDTFRTGSIAGAFGGVTTYLDQIQVGDDVPLVEAVERRLAEAVGESVVDYGFHVNPRVPRREVIDQIPEVAARGLPTFKFFMNYEGWALPDELIFRGMQHVARAGGTAIVHAENRAVIDELTRQLVEEGKVGPEWYAAARPSVLEGEATHRALAMAHVAGARVLIFHVSCAEAARELAAARARGQDALGEVCIQYLAFDESRILDQEVGTAFHISPPLRDATHRAVLWQALADGGIDVISTDHGPRRRGRAAHGRLVPPPGTSGIEVRLALMHELGVRTGRLSLERWVDACCTRPAEVFGLPTKGRLEPGYDADVVVFDPERELTLAADVLHSDVDHATYDGITVRGWPVTTICRGTVVVEEGRLVGTPGHGRLAPRASAADAR